MLTNHKEYISIITKIKKRHFSVADAKTLYVYLNSNKIYISNKNMEFD